MLFIIRVVNAQHSAKGQSPVRSGKVFPIEGFAVGGFFSVGRFAVPGGCAPVFLDGKPWGGSAKNENSNQKTQKGYISQKHSEYAEKAVILLPEVGEEEGERKRDY